MIILYGCFTLFLDGCWSLSFGSLRIFWLLLKGKLDVLLGRGEALALMKLCESSLESFLREEPDVYIVDDVNFSC